MNDPISNVQTIWASEARLYIRTDNKEKFPIMLYLKDVNTNDEYRIKADMNIEQIKAYYKLLKRVIELEESKGEVNEL